MQQLHTLKDIEQAIVSITVHQSPNLRCLYGRGRPA